MAPSYLGDLFLPWVQVKGHSVYKQILWTTYRREKNLQTNDLQVCHSLPSSTTTIIPLLSMLKVEHEEYFIIQIFLSLASISTMPFFSWEPLTNPLPLVFSAILKQTTPCFIRSFSKTKAAYTLSTMGGILTIQRIMFRPQSFHYVKKNKLGFHEIM